MKNQLPAHFCVIPFVHFSTKPNGQARICCFSQDTYVRSPNGESYKLGNDSLADIWHSKWMNSFRLRMLAADPLPECSFCYKEEASGKKSKRLIESERYMKDVRPLVEEIQQTGAISQGPRYFDLRLGNLCNLKCRTCNPLFSSSWEKEIEQNLQLPEVEMYRQLYFEAKENKNWYQNKHFWDQISEIGDSIQEVYITGGEPMLIEEHFMLLQSLIDRKISQNVVLRYNTNLTTVPHRLTDLLPQFKKVIFSCSIDGLQEKNEWLRPPSRWTKVMENLSKVSQLSGNIEIDINCTISVYNVLNFSDFVGYFKMLSKSLQRHIEISADLLHEPSFMSLELLPLELRKTARQQLKSLLEDVELNLNSYEEREIKALIKILESSDIASQDALRQLYSHTKAFDRMRSQNFATTFPELSLLFSSLT